MLEICAQWDVRAAVVGRVTEGGSLRIRDGFDGPILADVPASSLHDAAPLYNRPMQEARPVGLAGDSLPVPADCGADLVALLADNSWVYSQYDHMLFLNTVVAPGGDAAVLRLKHPTTGTDTGRGLALTTDGNHRWCAVDPRHGTARVVAESVLNLACVAARPVALVNCLNFGNPEHPSVMWQLSEAIDGMAEACRAFDLPVVGGNVSLYNETAGSNIDPTPIVGVLGVIDSLTAIPAGCKWHEGDRIVLLHSGAEDLTLDGSRWAFDRGRTVGACQRLTSPRTPGSLNLCGRWSPRGRSGECTMSPTVGLGWPSRRWPSAPASAAGWRASATIGPSSVRVRRGLSRR